MGEQMDSSDGAGLPHGARAVVHPDGDPVAAATAARLITTIVDRQSVDPLVHVVLTGGTVGIKTLAQVAASPAAAAIDWSGVHLWWGDERFLPADDPDRNETQARAALLDALGAALPAANVHYMPRLDPAAGVASPDDAAERYENELRAFAPAGQTAPVFDVVLLGMGPDGHVASLFPGNDGLSASGATTGVVDSPKPPSERVSLTFDTINGARAVWLVVAGSDKAEALASAWSGADRDVTPAAHVHGSEQTLWLVDLAATSAV